MNDYYIDQVQVFIDGKESVVITISGQTYNPNQVKKSAENQVREQNKGKRITSVILTHKDYDLEEYKQITGGTPPWQMG